MPIVPLVRPRRAHRPAARRAALVAAAIAATIGLLVVASAGAVAPASARPVPAPALAPATSAPAPPPHGAYRPPVDAPVVGPFRAPAHRYGAGNRGLDYALAPLTPVRAVADGEVIFAGPVAGTEHVTIRHADGLRSSYSFLATVAVGRGQHLRQGEVVGLSGEALHLGVRAPDDTYLDPALLFGAPRGAHLVPGGDDGATAPPPPEPPLLARVVADRLAPLQRHLDAVAPASLGGLLDRTRYWARLAWESTPAPHLARIAAGVRDWRAQRDRCTPAGEPVARPTGRRILVEVAGFGSTSGTASIDDVDHVALGYAAGDVVRFSYGGGRTPPRHEPSPDLRGLPVAEHDARRSQDDLRRSGDRLADLLADVSRAAPGVPVDVVAHSQGGVVARIALAAGEDRGDLPAEVATLVTLGSPHGGADLAGAVATGRTTAGGLLAQQNLRALLGIEADGGLAAGAQLAPTSPVIRALADRPPPPSVRATAIGARGDLVVPAARTAMPGAEHTVVPLAGVAAHSALPGDPATTRELALALAGRPPTCRSLSQALTDLVATERIVQAEARAGLVAGTALAVAPSSWPALP